MKFKIGIVGNGYVGRATRLLECEDVECYTYDINSELCDPLGTTLVDLKKCDFIFVCVPTPMKKNGACDLSFVKAAIKSLTANGIRKRKIILRSTVPVGTSEKLKVNFMPEFLTEKNLDKDFYNNEVWILGTSWLKKTTQDQDSEVMNFDPLITKFNDLISKAHEHDRLKNGNVVFTTTQNAELVKYGRNSFLALKVSFFNELEEFCLKNKVNFKTVKKLICADERIGDSHSQVPGPDGKRGFGGTCLPKDLASMIVQMKKSKTKVTILKACQKRNEKIDRPEKDWEDDKGRAVSG